MRPLLALLALLALAAGAAHATSTTPGAPLPAVAALKAAAARFPQPVRIGDLAGRELVTPTESQHVLGRVAAAAVRRLADGSMVLVIERGGFLGLGATPITLPLDDVALSGTLVVLVGKTSGQLDQQPRSDEGEPVPPATMIRMGIVGPFH